MTNASPDSFRTRPISSVSPDHSIDMTNTDSIIRAASIQASFSIFFISIISTSRERSFYILQVLSRNDKHFAVVKQGFKTAVFDLPYLRKMVGIHNADPRYPDHRGICRHIFDLGHGAVDTVHVFHRIEKELSVHVLDVVNIGKVYLHLSAVYACAEAYIKAAYPAYQPRYRIVIFRIFDRDRQRLVLYLSCYYLHYDYLTIVL